MKEYKTTGWAIFLNGKIEMSPIYQKPIIYHKKRVAESSCLGANEKIKKVEVIIRWKE